MKDGQVIKPGTVIFSSSGPWYGVVADRDFWLKRAEVENSETVRNFLEMEKDKLQEIPVLVLGDFIASKITVGGGGCCIIQKYVQRWDYTNLEAHVSFIRNPEDLLESLRHGFNFHGSQYLRQVYSELGVLVDYLEYSSLEKGPGDAGFLMWNLFQKAIPR